MENSNGLFFYGYGESLIKDVKFYAGGIEYEVGDYDLSPKCSYNGTHKRRFREICILFTIEDALRVWTNEIVGLSTNIWRDRFSYDCNNDTYVYLHDLLREIVILPQF